MTGLVAALLLAAAATSATAPASSFCIAGVCLDVPEREILRQYGAGRAFPPEGPWEHCYRARAKSTFLKVIIDEAQPDRTVTAILASIEPTCTDAGPARLGTDWTGCRGIRLFDPVDRLREVGATRRDLRDKGYPWDGSPYEVSQFDYACEPDRACSVMASAFARGDRIIAIAIWSPDC